jgi:hypothetical protein
MSVLAVEAMILDFFQCEATGTELNKRPRLFQFTQGNFLFLIAHIADDNDLIRGRALAGMESEKLPSMRLTVPKPLLSRRIEAPGKGSFVSPSWIRPCSVICVSCRVTAAGKAHG